MFLYVDLFSSFSRKGEAGGSETASKRSTERKESSGKESSTQQKEEERLAVRVRSCSCGHLFNFFLFIGCFFCFFIYLECRKEDDPGSKKKHDGDPEPVKKDVSPLSLPLSHSLFFFRSFFNSFTVIPPPFPATQSLFLICSYS